jgi:hypothetical protein
LSGKSAEGVSAAAEAQGEVQQVEEVASHQEVRIDLPILSPPPSAFRWFRSLPIHLRQVLDVSARRADDMRALVEKIVQKASEEEGWVAQE